MKKYSHFISSQLSADQVQSHLIDKFTFSLDIRVKETASTKVSISSNMLIQLRANTRLIASNAHQANNLECPQNSI